jgi:hypothetical protein
MLLTYENQTVDFNIEYIQRFKNIGMSLSGGTDSALLFYLLCKFVPDIEIYPWCGIDLYRPAHIFYAREIYQIICEMFPKSNINPLYEFDIDIRDPYWIEYSKKKVNIHNIPQNGFIKGLICSVRSKEISQVNMHINALTGNPPYEETVKYGFYHTCEERRFSKNNETKLETTYKPFRNVDKKWISGMYKKFELMETIYLYTQSCTGFPNDTDWFTKPCKKCYWCHEKKWAFGTYDLCFDK